jgi:hypothetical protein
MQLLADGTCVFIVLPFAHPVEPGVDPVMVDSARKAGGWC